MLNIFSLFLNLLLFHYSLIYDYFGKMNALKCILKLPAEFMKKGFHLSALKNYYSSSKTIRIFNGREVRIENSVTRIAIRHHEASLVMLNSYPKYSHQTTIIDSFSCILSLRRLLINYTLFYQFCVKRSTNVRFGSYLRRPDVMHEVALYPVV